PGGADVLKRLLKEGDPALRPAILTLAALWRVNELRPTLEGIARAEGAPDATRRAALEGLAEFGTAGVLKEVAAGTGPVRVRAWAASALSRVDLPLGASAAAAVLSGASDEIETLINAFLARQGGSEALAAALASSGVS